MPDHCRLDQRVRDLEARLKLNSTNSSKPPSSDPDRPEAQAAHTTVPAEVAADNPGMPRLNAPWCPRRSSAPPPTASPVLPALCSSPPGDDLKPLIHQVADLPKIEPIVDQYRLHRLTCSRCGATTCGTLPEGVPTGSFSPYTQAVLATLAGAYRLSKRQIQQLAGDLFGLSISTGMICKLERQSAAALAEPLSRVGRDRSWRPRRSISMRRAGARTDTRPGCG